MGKEVRGLVLEEVGNVAEVRIRSAGRRRMTRGRKGGGGQAGRHW